MFQLLIFLLFDYLSWQDDDTYGRDSAYQHETISTMSWYFLVQTKVEIVNVTTPNCAFLDAQRQFNFWVIRCIENIDCLAAAFIFLSLIQE